MIAIISSSRNLKAKENSLISNIQRITHSGIPYSSYLWLISEGHSLFARWLRIPSVRQIAKQHNIPNYTTKNINNPKLQALISRLEPDVILCAHFNQLVSYKTYSLAKDVSLNIHPSLLPDLKGVDPAFYALLEEYKNTGTSLHYLTEKFDEGNVISNSPISIENNDSLFSLNIKLFQAGGNLLLQFFDMNNSNSYLKTDDTYARYDSWPEATEVKRFRRKRKLFTNQDIKWLVSKT